jgi:hypothetical protein
VFQDHTICPHRDKEKWNPEYILLSKCYVMDEKFMDIAFKNTVLAALMDAHDNQPFYRSRYPGQPAINIIYGGTLESSPARRLLVDIWVDSAVDDCLEVKHLNDYLHHSFVLEFPRALLGRKSKGEVNGTNS